MSDHCEWGTPEKLSKHYVYTTAPRVISVIETTANIVGEVEFGKNRTITQYHTPDGKFLAEYDPWGKK